MTPFIHCAQRAASTVLALCLGLGAMTQTVLAAPTAEISVAQVAPLSGVLANPDVVALFGYAGTANVSKLLLDGVLDAGGAPLVARHCTRLSTRTFSMCAPATWTRLNTWCTRWPRWA